MLLARIMSKDELEQFRENRTVTDKNVPNIKRIWDKRNAKGKSGDYTFMVMNNWENIMFNYSSVIDYLKVKLQVDFIAKLENKYGKEFIQEFENKYNSTEFGFITENEYDVNGFLEYLYDKFGKEIIIEACNKLEKEDFLELCEDSCEQIYEEYEYKYDKEYEEKDDIEKFSEKYDEDKKEFINYMWKKYGKDFPKQFKCNRLIWNEITEFSGIEDYLIDKYGIQFIQNIYEKYCKDKVKYESYESYLVNEIGLTVEDQYYLVFFEADNITENMIYHAGYDGFIRVDGRDDPNIYGQDESVEIAVPSYSSENFRMLKCTPVNYLNVDECFKKCIEDLHLLDKYELKKISRIYEDFSEGISKWWLNAEEDFSENWAKHRKNIIENMVFDYLEEKMRKEPFNAYFKKLFKGESLSDDENDKEILKFILTIKRNLKLDNSATFNMAGKCLQKLTNWGFDDIRDYEDDIRRKYRVWI